MHHRNRYPLISWPWYLRWTLGAGLALPVIVVGSLIVALYEALRGGLMAFLDSGAWQAIEIACYAILGERKN